jgi:hypothetical protein
MATQKKPEPVHLLAPLEQFQKLARALFAVPKKEIDEKLAEYEKAKRKRLRHA